MYTGTFSDCIRCPKLGDVCDRPNFVAMSPDELSSWCKERKNHLGLTNAKLAELSGMASGTVDGFLACSHPDFRFNTIRPMLQVLVGGSWRGEPCPDPANEAEKEMRERIKQLEIEVSWRDDKIQHLMQEVEILRRHNEETTKQTAETAERHTVSQDFMRSRLKRMDNVVKFLSVLLALAWALIIGALILDRLDPTRGFLWPNHLSWLNIGNLFGKVA